MTRDDAPSLNPTLAPHTTPAPEHRPAEQGPAPADLPPAPAVPAPSGDALSACEVEALMGGADGQPWPGQKNKGLPIPRHSAACFSFC